MKRFLIAALAAALMPCMASAAVIFEDDFESYADTTAMQAVWGAAGLGTLDAAAGNPGQSMAHPGGADNIVSIAEIQATPADPIIFSADIYDDGTSANKRLTAALRGIPLANLLEMGMYNNPNHYAARASLPGPGWVAFPNILDDLGDPIAPATAVVGWHRFQVVLDGTNATFTLDLGSTGIINSTLVAAAPFHVDGVDEIRLGGPSNLSSGGGGGNFDNISLTQGVEVPEPTTALLVAFGAVAFVARRK